MCCSTRTGDWLTVTETFPERLRAAGIDRLNERWEQGGFSPYRKVEPLPTMPGHYLDADGYHWKLTSNANRPWYMSVCDRNFTTEKMAKYAPFTRLVPMPTEEQLRETLLQDRPRDYLRGRCRGQWHEVLAGRRRRCLNTR